MKVSIGQRFIYRTYYKDVVQRREGEVIASTPHKIVLLFTDGSESHYPRDHFMKDLHPVLVRQLEVMEDA